MPSAWSLPEPERTGGRSHGGPLPRCPACARRAGDPGSDSATAPASLRGVHGPSLRLPDALVVATAIVLEAGRIITTDAGWPELAATVEVIGEPDEGTAHSGVVRGHVPSG